MDKVAYLTTFMSPEGCILSIDTLYTPNESLGHIKINHRRGCNFFWHDDLYVGEDGETRCIVRTITFDWWKEPAPSEQPDLFNQKE